MARLGCVCGEEMSNTMCPSPHRLKICYLSDMKKAIAKNPELKLWDYYTEWNPVENKQQNFDLNMELVEYWYCTSCKRVYQVEAIPCGKWLNVYKANYEEELTVIPNDGFDRLLVLWDVKMDELLESSPNLLLMDYIESYPYRILVNEQKNIVYVGEEKDNKVICLYELENTNKDFCELLEETDERTEE